MRVCGKEQLIAWLDDLIKEHTVIAPRLVRDHVLYESIDSGGQAALDFQRADMSPKSYLLPSSEVLMSFEKSTDELTIRDAAPSQSQVIFAVRPCDARGMRAMDGLLLNHEPADAYYSERRQATALVGLGCPQLWSECFCTSIGGAPDDPSGMDVMLYELDDEYLVDSITPRGEALLESLESRPSDRKPPKSQTDNSLTPVLEAENWPALFDDVYWRRLTDRCLSCHACTYVCPTCRCFDVRDYAAGTTSDGALIERVRSWDSCMASAYRRIAGGHNPRQLKAERLRNRYYCKFYYSPKTFDTIGCVGCGRCIAVCPVGIDIVEMLDDIAQKHAAAGGVADND